MISEYSYLTKWFIYNIHTYLHYLPCNSIDCSPQTNRHFDIYKPPAARVSSAVSGISRGQNQWPATDCSSFCRLHPLQKCAACCMLQLPSPHGTTGVMGNINVEITEKQESIAVKWLKLPTKTRPSRQFLKCTKWLILPLLNFSARLEFYSGFLRRFAMVCLLHEKLKLTCIYIKYVHCKKTEKLCLLLCCMFL